MAFISRLHGVNSTELVVYGWYWRPLGFWRRPKSVKSLFVWVQTFVLLTTLPKQSCQRRDSNSRPSDQKASALSKPPQGTHFKHCQIPEKVLHASDNSLYAYLKYGLHHCEKNWSSIRTGLNKFEVFGVQLELLF
jgi:hypothetical protein